MDKPKPWDQMLGMHAVLCIGYEDIDSCFIIVNSHSKQWGNNGKFKMRHDMLSVFFHHSKQQQQPNTKQSMQEKCKGRKKENANNAKEGGKKRKRTKR